MLRFASIILIAAPLTLAAADWPQFRGPAGDGHYSGPKLPTEFGPDKNVKWKTPVPGKGWSSPIVWKGKIYLTTAIEQPNKDQSLRAICLDVASGKSDWNTEVFLMTAASIPKIHGDNSHASATPTTDGERVYVHFGHAGTAALDLSGKALWKRTGFYEKPRHGSGGSPILVDGRLVFSCDAEDKQFVIALDSATGDTVWQTPRKSGASRMFSFSTPQVVAADGKNQILSTGSDMIAGYDPATGKELWRSKFSGYSIVQRPVVGHGRVYFSTAFDSPVLKAIRLGGSGDVTKTHTAFSMNKGVSNTPSFLLVGDDLFMVSDAGLMSCVDANTGEVIWSADLRKGKYWTSPIDAGGQIYITNTDGLVTLVEAGRTFNNLAEFDFKEKTLASFAGVDGALFVRTAGHVYKFEKR